MDVIRGWESFFVEIRSFLETCNREFDGASEDYSYYVMERLTQVIQDIGYVRDMLSAPNTPIDDAERASLRDYAAIMTELMECLSTYFQQWEHHIDGLYTSSSMGCRLCQNYSFFVLCITSRWLLTKAQRAQPRGQRLQSTLLSTVPRPAITIDTALHCSEAGDYNRHCSPLLRGRRLQSPLHRGRRLQSTLLYTAPMPAVAIATAPRPAVTIASAVDRSGDASRGIHMT